mmetsp:Transcript_2506/g.3466  ORF Transcript_2506/g.3466 Transcript_2506/m.3466 type:complete len:224 (+) Transcript_2506:261-932(+)|eukprot:CAMPEP_0196586108 /NCGR_PEP_ID=MMETSP1081-20130531/53152_1 /TAXON_ID=36882 /ORGANISM="Pyramimonas amylifera, Strain CCMP720" /LENGTH=223 /DNA_ID=CAMNT_0041907875 /DNA_START=258 /DNA_END=929 /DNA_ORIENTATION=-
MVLGIKRDPSTDLSYSTLSADKKHWASKGSTWSSQAGRFGPSLFVARQGFAPVHQSAEEQSRVDAMYNPRKGISENIHDGLVRSPTSMHSRISRSLDPNANIHNKTRLANFKLPLPYKVSLGPGSYLGKNPKAKLQNKGSYLDPDRPSACFLSLPRIIGAAGQDLSPDSSDIMQRDQREWLSKKFANARSPRFKPLHPVHDNGNSKLVYWYNVNNAKNYTRSM